MSPQRVFRLASLLLACIGLSCSVPTLEILPKPIDLTVIEVGGRVTVESSSILQLPDRFVWGATVLEGDDGRYHMLFNTWSTGPNVPKFSDSWVLFSEIGYAVSDFPDRGFEFQRVVVRGRKYEGDSLAWDAEMVTNPHLQRFAGRYFLYYVGSRDPGEQPMGSKGENVRQRDRVQQSQQIGVITFESFDELLDGQFERPEAPLLSPRTRVKSDNIVDPSPEGSAAMPDNIVVVNPSVVRSPLDGNYLLYFKGNQYDPGWKGVHGVAVGGSPEGPFEALDEYVFDVRMADGKIASAEDPFVWYHQTHGRFYAVVKDFTGTITGSKPGLAILESDDGLKWTRPAHPTFTNREIPRVGGIPVPVDRLERPQLLISPDGTPLVLYAACSIDPANDKTDGGTFNVHIALAIK